jgi:Flp pilus assembly protein protease CpaA
VFEILLFVPVVAVLAFSWPLIVTDFSEHRLPNRYTLSLILITLLSLFGYAGYSGEFSRLIQSLVVMLITFGIGWLLAKYADLGMGDVKLLVSLNGWLAWHNPWLVAGSLAMGLIAANVFAVAVWIKRKDPKEHIALGPFLLLGFCLSALGPSWQLITAVVSSLA